MRRSNRFSRRGAFGLWVWLFPLSQILHAIEERWQGYGFHIWLRQRADTPFSRAQTEMMHMAFALAMLVATWAAIRMLRMRWIVVTLGVLVLLNAMAHVGGAWVSASAGSGLITSLTMWLPLGACALVRGWRVLSRHEYFAGVGVGVAIQILVGWLAAFAAS